MRRNLVGNYLGAGVVAASQILAVPYYLRYLDAHGWGLLSAILSWTGALMVLEGGITLSVSRHFSHTRGGTWQATGGYLARLERRYLSAAGFVATAATMLLLFRTGEASDLLALALLLAAAQVSGAPYRGVLVGCGEQPRLNVLLGVFACLRQFGAVLVAASTASVSAVAITLVLVTLAEAIVRRATAFRALRRQEGSRSQAESSSSSPGMRGAALLTLGTLLGAGMAQLDRLFLSRRLEPADFGAYAVAATLSLAALQLIYPVSQALIPRLGEISRSGSQSLMTRITLLLLLGAVAMFALLGWQGDTVLAWWLADDATARAVFPLLMLHLGGTALNALCVPGHVALLALHRDRAILTINVIALAVQGGFLVFLWQTLGAKAGAISWIVANTVTFGGYWVARWKR